MKRFDLKFVIYVAVTLVLGSIYFVDAWPPMAPAGSGNVTNGDSHDHSGGDGAQIDHTGLSNIGTNTHAQIDTHITAHASDIANVVEDTTPQLGGDLDPNGHAITGYLPSIDEDNMASDSVAYVPTQQSTKAYGDGLISTHESTYNHTNYNSAYTHVSSTGADHTYIDQSVVSGASPTFTGTNFTGIPLNGLTAAGGALSANLGAYQHLLGTNVDTSAFRVGLGASYFEVVNSGGSDVIVRLVGSNITANLGTFTVSTDSTHARTGTTADDDMYLDAYNGAAYVHMLTLKAGNGPYLYLGPAANSWQVDQTGAVTRNGTASLATVEVDRIPITAFTDGASPPAAAAVISSADGRFNCRAFDGASNEDVFFTWKAPPDIDATQGIKFSVSGVVGSATAPANTEVIAFSLAGVSLGNSDAAGSVGTAQTSSLTADATYAQYDSLDTAFSSAITVTNLAAGETVSFELIRLATTTDTYAQDFHPHTILIKYVRLHNATF